MPMPLQGVSIMDDVVPQWAQDHLELIALGKCKENMLPTGMMPFYCKYDSTAEENNNSPMSFTHILKSHTALSDYLPQVSILPQIACDINNIKMHDIIQARMFIVVPHETKLDYYAPHIDLPEDHTVCIYYVNDADGDTVFFDNDLNEVKRVSPKKGRLILFNGKIMHGGGIPKNGPRCIINFDLFTD